MKKLKEKKVKLKKETKVKVKKSKYPYVLIRGDRSGVFVGELKSRKGQEVVLLNAKNIWYWSGATCLSQLAQEGTKDVENCKIPCPVDVIEILDAVSIMYPTHEARQSIDRVPVWSE